MRVLFALLLRIAPLVLIWLRNLGEHECDCSAECLFGYLVGAPIVDVVEQLKYLFDREANLHALDTDHELVPVEVLASLTRVKNHENLVQCQLVPVSDLADLDAHRCYDRVHVAVLQELDVQALLGQEVNELFTSDRELAKRVPCVFEYVLDLVLGQVDIEV